MARLKRGGRINTQERASLNGLTDRTVVVHTEGGPLRVAWRDDNKVMLTGPAEVIYEGRWLKD